MQARHDIWINLRHVEPPLEDIDHLAIHVQGRDRHDLIVITALNIVVKYGEFQHHIRSDAGNQTAFKTNQASNRFIEIDPFADRIDSFGIQG